jgi:hypothetical protein
VLRVEQRGAGFAGGGAVETDAARRAGEKSEERRFVEALKVNDAGVSVAAQSANGGKGAGKATIEGDWRGQGRVRGEKGKPFAFDEPVEARGGKSVAQSGDGGKGVDDVAQRAEAHDKEAIGG